MPTITSTGLGSGLDISTLVDSLVAAEKDPASQLLDTRQAELDAKIAAYGELKTSLSSFQTDISTLKKTSTFNGRTVSSSDTSIASATVSSLADVGTHSLTVTQLAQEHTLVTADGTFSSLNDVLGTGTLTIRFGTTDYTVGTDTYTSFTQDTTVATQTITIDSTNNTLSSFRDYINAGSYGITASIIDDGDNDYRLIIASANGGDSNSMEIVVNDTGDANHTDTSGLSRLAFSSAATNMDQTLEAKDSIISLDGLTVNRNTNTIDDVLNGVTLNLNKVAASTNVTLAIAQDSSGIKDKITSFVDSYNVLFEKIAELTAKETDTDEDGIDDGPAILMGDNFTRAITFQLREIVGSQVTGLTGDILALADLGITTNYNVVGEVDGTLGINSTTFDNALKNNLDDIASLFAPAGTTTNIGVSYTSNNSLTKAGTYAVNVTTLATQGVLNGGNGALAGLPGTPITVGTTNDNFTIRVDGTTSSSITLTNGDYATGAALAAEVQAQINADTTLSAAGKSVSVSFNDTDDRLEITSTSYGSGSSVAITAVEATTAATIGLSVATGTNGVDTAGTINGTTALGDGQFLLSTTGNSTGLKLLISSNTTGDLGTVTFTRGIASDLDTDVDTYIGITGTLDDQVDGLKTSLVDISEERELLDFRMDKLEARLLQQFSVMDRLVANLQSTSSYLTQQFASLSNNDS